MGFLDVQEKRSEPPGGGGSGELPAKRARPDSAARSPRAAAPRRSHTPDARTQRTGSRSLSKELQRSRSRFTSSRSHSSSQSPSRSSSRSPSRRPSSERRCPTDPGFLCLHLMFCYILRSRKRFLKSFGGKMHVCWCGVHLLLINLLSHKVPVIYDCDRIEVTEGVHARVCLWPSFHESFGRF